MDHELELKILLTLSRLPPRYAWRAVRARAEAPAEGIDIDRLEMAAAHPEFGHLIQLAFNWGETKEGSEYWYSLAKENF